MSTSVNKECENEGGQGQMQRQIEKVETVDFYTSAGHSQEQVQRVQIVHELHSISPRKASASGGIFENVAASVASAINSTKDAISNSRK